MNFEEANRVVHPVETQWHFSPMTDNGWVAEDRTGVGFARSYRYTHPTIPHVVTATTGASSDYWSDNAGGRGYWSDLRPRLFELAKM